jgi:hypothetical protein
MLDKTIIICSLTMQFCLRPDDEEPAVQLPRVHEKMLQMGYLEHFNVHSTRRSPETSPDPFLSLVIGDDETGAKNKPVPSGAWDPSSSGLTSRYDPRGHRHSGGLEMTKEADESTR